ncbi:MAG: hypothetical protein JSU93_04585 [Methanobacteriota archaeon]|nr:MAG: hypothetical protein JSU93_04585 [Euryarchaeota archaeon]
MTTERAGEQTRSDDLPTVVANIIAIIPRMLLRIGFRYLTMKRRVRKSARAMEAGMRARGMPEHLIRRLSISYENDSRFMEIILRSFINRGASR